MVRLGITLILCCTIVSSAFSQLIVIAIPKGQPRNQFNLKNKNKKSGRVQDTVVVTPLSLPFWDDFSVSDSPYYPDTTHWLYGESVSLSTGIGINPPSLGMVSFDGLDSLGRPYDVTNVLDKGYGDYLVSKPIRLGDVPLDQRDSVYLSIYFQWQGNGEPPDPGDQLEIDFRKNTSDSSNWATMATVTPNGEGQLEVSTVDAPLPVLIPISDSVFYKIIVAVSDTVFFYNQFEFRIRSYGRLSGPWDTWNVDYVYLNAHRFATDLSFPDRTVYSPLNLLFSDYWSVPVKHFFADSSASPILVHPSFAVTNLRQEQATVGQPLNYTSYAEISEWNNKVPTTQKVLPLDTKQGIFPDLKANERITVNLNKIPTVQDFDAGSDSIRVTLVAGIKSGDNVLDTGGYTLNFVPIDFRVNDTTKTTYVMANYYAYDDGTAEFGAGLNQPAAEVAYLFKMKTAAPDTIVALDLYFPDFGDETDQDIELRIRKDTSITGLLYKETVTLQRSALNIFWRHILNTNTIGVRDSFLIGWMQTSAAVIAAGLDKSNDSGGKIFYNVNGYWEQNTEVQGSLMIRPVFGKGGVVTGLPPTPKPLDVYPNPNAGAFYLSRKPDQLEIVDYTGRRMEFSQEGTDDQLKVTLANATSGIYILKAFISGKWITRKVMVKGQ